VLGVGLLVEWPFEAFEVGHDARLRPGLPPVPRDEGGDCGLDSGSETRRPAVPFDRSPDVSRHVPSLAHRGPTRAGNGVPGRSEANVATVSGTAAQIAFDGKIGPRLVDRAIWSCCLTTRS
jgi:hypothetical protein